MHGAVSSQTSLAVSPLGSWLFMLASKWPSKLHIQLLDFSNLHFPHLPHSSFTPVPESEVHVIRFSDSRYLVLGQGR